MHPVVEGPAAAPLLVLSGSLGSDLSMWEPQVADLCRDFRVVRYDHRGHGGSPAPPGPYRLDDLVDDVVGLLDDLGADRAHFCGLSLGGMVGLRLAARRPDRLDRLVVCCTSARLDPSAWHRRAATVRTHGTEAVADAVVERWFTPAFAAKHRDLVARMRAVIAATDGEGYAGCCEAIATMTLVDDLPVITAPTRVLAGAQDPATPPEHGERIAAALLHGRLQVVDDAAHLANVEQPAAVTAAILDHLSAGWREEAP